MRCTKPEELVDAYVERRATGAGPVGWFMPTPYLHVPELRALALYKPLMEVLESRTSGNHHPHGELCVGWFARAPLLFGYKKN